MTTGTLLPSVAILVAGAAGAWLLRRAWRTRGERGALIAAGWLLIAAATVLPAWVLGSARGPFIALTIIPVAALAVVTSGLQVRARRTARAGVSSDSLAPEPLERPSTAWRGVLRWLLAGPIGMIAALSVGVCYAVWMPGLPQTRLLIGGIIVPVAWGGAMAWTLADNRILRATAVLVGTTLVCFTAAVLRGFA